MNDSMTIEIAVRLLGPLQYEMQGIASLALPVRSTVADVVNQIRTANPTLADRLLGELNEQSTQVLVNGRHVAPAIALSTELQDQDVVSFLPPIPGG